ncbi:ABC transporter ATP-binding protein [Paractinoplanes brasiliensis]|uniref:Peptide/nickel transport system ATP-binding protein n=1 Tax=Paractinoplanes brasiliensis TaxID=52695 RepID=A0A4R6JWC5_9ACTN|nr:ABC transporter ATP-binding protein [Actinoplanes brasiliensis]TDO41054.1 peptide/nickel transport system ATP-binding protein [Actinoplanes brasiliensis]GID26123.1 dipeptide/oligopeptide/nickel ABC transporter ATP-binding protein [Actinoplanes brasiliensis]
MSDQSTPAPHTVARVPRTPAANEEAYLEVTDLQVQFPTADGLVRAVQGLSYSVPLRRTLAIVGESGSGKSVSSMAVMGLHDRKVARISGSIKVGGREIVNMSDKELEGYRGGDAAMIFQDPQSSLHPYFTIGDQIMESYRAHHNVSKRKAKDRAVEMLGRVGIPNPRRRVDQYPHEFSGGMRQRAMIAMALVNDPKLLIADEPTTALDVTVQAQILDLISDLQRDFGSAVVFITHDLGVVAEIADDILVMYAGTAIEHGPVNKILGEPLHPYAWGLLESIPALTGEPQPLHPIPGSPPSLLAVPTGCPFHPRCEFKDRVPGDLCTTLKPDLIPRTGDLGRTSRCHLKEPDKVFETEVLPRLP